MTTAEFIWSTISVASALLSIVSVRYFIAKAPEVETVDEARVRELIDTAPMHRLDNLLVK